MKLMRITIVEPARPTKNMTSSSAHTENGEVDHPSILSREREDRMWIQSASETGPPPAMRYTRPRMQLDTPKYWAAAGLSAALLELPFPLAGPMPPARSIVAWFALVPLIWAVMRMAEDDRHPLRSAFLIAYVCGVLWFAGNCYWIYDTMLIHGGLPPILSALVLLLFSLVLGGYFGLFGLGLAFVQRRTGSTYLALALAPFLWTAIDLAAARITCVPWDQLGYSQVDNSLVTLLAPWTGVYGISFLLVAVNALLAAGLLPRRGHQRTKLSKWALLACGLAPPYLRISLASPASPFRRFPTPVPSSSSPISMWKTPATGSNPASGTSDIADFKRLAAEQCKTYIAGIPQTGATTGEIVCPPHPIHPDLVAWPESPAPFFEQEARFKSAMSAIARGNDAPLIVSGVGSDFQPRAGGWVDHVSAMVFTRRRQRGGPLRQNPPRALGRIRALSKGFLFRAQAHRQSCELRSGNQPHRLPHSVRRRPGAPLRHPHLL